MKENLDSMRESSGLEDKFSFKRALPVNCTGLQPGGPDFPRLKQSPELEVELDLPVCSGNDGLPINHNH